MRLMRLLDFRIARWGIFFWMAIQAWSGVFDGFFVLSYKFGALGVDWNVALGRQQVAATVATVVRLSLAASH